MTGRQVDLNADLGESFGRWTLGDDESLVAFITSANLACGFHAGDPVVMDRTVALCAANGVAVGAQPGFPDLQGFGRRTMAFAPAEVEALIRYQVGALFAMCSPHGVELRHVKPHGALYNQAANDDVLASAIARGVASFSRDLLFFGSATSAAMGNAAADAGLTFVREGFADRRYRPDGTLQPRSEVGSVISSPEDAAAQALQIVDGHVTATDGTSVTISADTICCHGDTPGALEIAAAVRTAVEQHGYSVASP